MQRFFFKLPPKDPLLSDDFKEPFPRAAVGMMKSKGYPQRSYAAPPYTPVSRAKEVTKRQGNGPSRLLGCQVSSEPSASAYAECVADSAVF